MEALNLVEILHNMPEDAIIMVEGEEDVVVQKYEHAYKKNADNQRPALVIDFTKKKRPLR